MTIAIEPPPISGVVGELRGLLEFPRLLLRSPSLARAPRGRGPVVVLPGYNTTDGSTVLLRAYLSYLGYEAHGWRLGRNRGDVAELMPRVLTCVDALARDTGRAVRLVGWSLGGFIAREVARERPDTVAHVVTLGSPVVGGPKYTIVGEQYRRRGFDLDAIEAQIEARNATPLRTPITAIYSRTDCIVAWQACIDRHCATVEHVEVETTHLGLGFSPEVYGIIARRFASERPAGPTA